MGKYRNWISVFLAFSFLITALTGLVMEFVFKNHTIEELHVWAALLMVTVALLHIVINRMPFYNYLKNVKFSAIITIAMASFLLLFAFSVERGEGKKGMNPRFMAKAVTQASINSVAAIFHQSADEVIGKMRSQNMIVDSKDQILADVAKINKVREDDVLRFFINDFNEI